MTVREWLKQADPRNTKVYFIGHLAQQREWDRTLDILAREWWEASEAGLVNLCQWRMPDGRFAYAAQRTQEISE